MGNDEKKDEREDEIMIKKHNIEEIDMDLYGVVNSICKIIINLPNNIRIFGSGFLIKLYKNINPLFCLMTNEHVIKKTYIEQNQSIEIYYHNQAKNIKIKLDKKERFIRDFRDIDLDVIIIEILSKDNIKEDYFLLPNIDYINKYNNLINSKIYIPQFPELEKLSNSKGKIIKINKNEFSHDACTKQGSSGSPILLQNTKNVIGIHKQGCPSKNENYGDFIFPILNLLEKENYNKYNYITSEIEIKQENEEYPIINSYEQFFRENEKNTIMNSIKEFCPENEIKFEDMYKNEKDKK